MRFNIQQRTATLALIITARITILPFKLPNKKGLHKSLFDLTGNGKSVD
jgi:hypothetical protein